jgi:ankyrin repeat protein
VTELVKNYCDDIEAQDSTNMRPLHVAASTADLRLVRFLVAEAGADVNAKDGKALTPLHYACQADGTRDAELIRFLVERGAQTESADNDGKTPLHFASRVPHKCFLVQHLVEKTNTAVDSRDNFGNTSLHLACAAGNITVAKYLLGQHADANAENVYKEQPIHAACNDVHFDLLKELVNDYGACVNVVDRNGWTPLLRTCMRSVYIPRRLDCVRWLLERGAGVDARNKYGQTPLLLALANLHDEVAALLVSHGANRLTTDRRRNNALCFARTADMARLLVEGSSPSAIERGVAYTLLTSKNALGETPADLARRRLLDVQNPIGVALGQYILSFTERPAAVPHFNNLFEASTQLNPDLSPVQRHYVSRMCNLLGHSECGQDLKFHILGFLSPLDVMNE